MWRSSFAKSSARAGPTPRTNCAGVKRGSASADREGTEDIALAKIQIGSRARFNGSAYEYILGEKALEFVPLLIEVLNRLPAPDCVIANEVLQDLTGLDAPLAFPEAPLPRDGQESSDLEPTPESRRQVVEKWRGWWEANKGRAVPLRREPRRSYDISPARRRGAAAGNQARAA